MLAVGSHDGHWYLIAREADRWTMTRFVASALDDVPPTPVVGVAWLPECKIVLALADGKLRFAKIAHKTLDAPSRSLSTSELLEQQRQEAHDLQDALFVCRPFYTFDLGRPVSLVSLSPCTVLPFQYLAVASGSVSVCVSL